MSAVITDRENGTYHIHYEATNPKQYKMDVKVNGERIGGAPFQLSAVKANKSRGSVHKLTKEVLDEEDLEANARRAFESATKRLKKLLKVKEVKTDEIEALKNEKEKYEMLVVELKSAKEQSGTTGEQKASSPKSSPRPKRALV